MQMMIYRDSVTTAQLFARLTTRIAQVGIFIRLRLLLDPLLLDPLLLDPLS